MRDLIKNTITLLCIGLLLQGCAAKTKIEEFSREDVDLSYITKIAVLPFENHTKDEFAAQRMRDITITQVLAMGLFDVVDKGVVDSALMDFAVEPGKPIDSPILKRLGKRLGVDAFLMGEVNEVGEDRRGSMSFPLVSLTMRLVDSKAVLVLWRASGHKSGYSTMYRLFGISPKDSFEVSMELVRDMLRTIPVSGVRGGMEPGGEMPEAGPVVEQGEDNATQ